METGTTEFGRKPFVPYGLYRAHGFFNPFLAKVDDESKVSDEDMSLFWEAMEKMFEFDRSAARGEMNVRAVLVFSHDDPKGNAPAHKLFELVKIDHSNKKPDEESKVRQFAQYTVKVSDSDMPQGETWTHADHEAIPEGITLTRLV